LENKPDPKIVEAYPTKDFFITMLVKDIELIRAILDLVDNSVDGARRLRTEGNYSGLTVRIELSAAQFKITDNCGGIPVDVARHYAFRFGRPSNMPKTLRSVGQFGVGMKRALFKLGKHFRVESATTASTFVIDVNVEEWKQHDKWEFDFKELKEGRKIDLKKTGTTVLVTELHDPVGQEFALETFQSKLKREIEAAHQESMERGIAISLNKLPLQFRPNELLNSDELRPAYDEFVPEIFKDRTPVTVKLFAGVGKSDPIAAGWSIYCNGRLVLESDQTLITGWGEGGGKVIPKFHNQFARFRGYIFFDSDDAELLPWNTTKTGVDSDSGLYKSVRQKMVTMMRPVIDFLNKLDAEKDRGGTDKPLTDIVTAAGAVRLAAVHQGSFHYAARSAQKPTPPAEQKISYLRPTDRIKKVKAALRASTLKEVGEKTFDYYYVNECED
jgi:histidine kinase/DNA gyrase B/HSP90-like ATPase